MLVHHVVRVPRWGHSTASQAIALLEQGPTQQTWSDCLRLNSGPLAFTLLSKFLSRSIRATEL